MRARLFAAAGVSLVMLLTGCAGGKKTTSAGSSSSAAPASGAPAQESASPTSAAAGAAPGSTAAGTKATAKPGGTGGTSSSGGAAGTLLSPGGAALPKAGKYVYASTTRQEGNPSATPRSSDATVEYLSPKDLGGGKWEVKYRAGSDQGTSTTTEHYDATHVVLVSVTFSGPQGQIECKFNTPTGGVEIAKFPLKAEKYARQEWKNDTCEGWHEEEILRAETVTTAGRTFDTWVAETTTYVKIKFDSPGGGGLPAGQQAIETTVKSTQWLAPDIGVEVKSNGTSEFTLAPNPPSKASAERLLKSYPK